jgi:Fe-S-cluster containining protein
MAAVCLDLRQYAPQVPLMCEILGLISGDAGRAVRDAHDSSIWVLRRGRRQRQRMEPADLTEYTCARLSGTDLPPEIWVDICRRVFRTHVRLLKDPDSGQWELSIQTGMAGFACRQCGHCCRRLDYRHELTPDDVHRWRRMGRLDILDWVGESRRPDGSISYQIWVVPGTNRFAQTCPFLKQGASNHLWICAIHELKPQICRQYPITRKHAQMTGCPGFDD